VSSIQQIEGFVLAGGESSRMGRPKALLEIAGVPLVVRTARLVEGAAGSCAVIGNFEAYKSLGLRLVADDFPGAGPLGGIATALRVSNAPSSLIVACDLPYLTLAWLKHLTIRAIASSGNVVMPVSLNGPEPLCAVYRKECEVAIRSALDRGERKVKDVVCGLSVDLIEPDEWKAFDSGGVLFRNMNSPDDYEEARLKLAGT
jgi:molybdopterin-guanine dinucleotide biosynthesis protein A